MKTAPVILASISRRDEHLGLLTTDNPSFARFVKELLESKDIGYKVDLKRLPTHGEELRSDS
jgi:hypothetical protein